MHSLTTVSQKQGKILHSQVWLLQHQVRIIFSSHLLYQVLLSCYRRYRNLLMSDQVRVPWGCWGPFIFSLHSHRVGHKQVIVSYKITIICLCFALVYSFIISHHYTMVSKDFKDETADFMYESHYLVRSIHEISKLHESLLLEYMPPFCNTLNDIGNSFVAENTSCNGKDGESSSCAYTTDMDDLLNTDSAESVRFMGYNNQQIKRGIAAVISKNGMFSVNCHRKHSYIHWQILLLKLRCRNMVFSRITNQFTTVHCLT